eukprot:11188722-Lingulodinium_polyedra.AAC.1
MDKKGGRQRLVLDCCSTNQRFLRVPAVQIGGVEAFCQGEVEPGQDVFLATAGITICIYQFLLPPEFNEFFTTQGID